MSEHVIPYDFGEARQAAYKFQFAQLDGERALRDASNQLAQAERAYRVELAKEMVRQHAAGVAWTACQALARGNEHVAQLRYERDVAKGVFEACPSVDGPSGSSRTVNGVSA